MKLTWLSYSMHARRSLSRYVSQTGHINALTLKSSLVACWRHYATQQDSSGPSTSPKVPLVDASQLNPVLKGVPLSKTLGELSNKGTHSDIAKPSHRRTEYAAFKKPPLPTSSKKPEKRQRLKEKKKATKRAIRKAKERDDINRSFGIPHKQLPAKDGSLTLKLALGDLPPKQETPPTSGFSTEPWSHESWKGENVFDDNPLHEDRPLPPHILKQDVARSGVMMPLDQTLEDVAPIVQQQPIDTLSHGLDRVLFNPGVHWLQDPRSRVYNFTPWLQKIPKVNDFAFERLTGFVKSSRDEELRSLAKREGKKFAGSTSSLSGMLCHTYFLLSEYKDVDYSSLSQHFKNQPSSFTSGQRMPTSVLLNYKDGVYAIDSYSADHDDPDKNVLTWLGTLLENFLTKNPEGFKKFMRSESSPSQKGEVSRKQAYRYAKSQKFVMRSQLDCHDSRLPSTGIFDIKTRACVSVRMDILNYEENSGYLIKNQTGIFESFEREYYDLIRSGFLKYSFQARIGNMDGVMVTYHNTERIFGFQYISLDEMDGRLFGPTPGLGNKVFRHCVSLLEEIIEEASSFFPEQSVICSFETRMPGKVLEVFVQPEEWNGPKEEVPIKKLIVTLDHQSGGLPTRAVTAMRQPDHWTVSYQIGRPKLSDEDVRRDYAGMEFRKKRLLVLPSSVSSMDEAKAFWDNLSFSKKIDEEVAKEFRPDSFTLATAAVEKYRELSRQGRLYSQRMAEEEADRPKIVLGHGQYEEEWVDLWKSRDAAVEETQKLPASDRDVWNVDALQASMGTEGGTTDLASNAPRDVDTAPDRKDPTNPALKFER